MTAAGIYLNIVDVEATCWAGRAPADHPGSLERVADGDHPIANAQGLVGELHEREGLRRLDLQERDVGALVGADQLRVELVVLVEADLDLAAAIDDVVVGDDEPVSGDEESGALRLRRPRREFRPGRR